MYVYLEVCLGMGKAMSDVALSPEDRHSGPPDLATSVGPTEAGV